MSELLKPLRMRTGRTATLTLAGVNASAKVKAQADDVCEGVDDHIKIQAALDSLTSGRN